jgi:hypothetical protein
MEVSTQAPAIVSWSLSPSPSITNIFTKLLPLHHLHLHHHHHHHHHCQSQHCCHLHHHRHHNHPHLTTTTIITTASS